MLLEMIEQTIHGILDNMHDTGAEHWVQEPVGNVAEAQELFDQQLRLLELMLECLKVPVKSDALMFAHRLAGDQWEMIEWHLLEGTYINAEELVDREVPLQGTKYVHDCNKCIPLGPFKDHAGVVDLYWCSNAVMPTVTVRYSSGPHEEFSGGCFTLADGHCCRQLLQITTHCQCCQCSRGKRPLRLILCRFCGGGRRRERFR